MVEFEHMPKAMRRLHRKFHKAARAVEAKQAAADRDARQRAVMLRELRRCIREIGRELACMEALIDRMANTDMENRPANIL